MIANDWIKDGDDERIAHIFDRGHFRFVRIGGTRYLLIKPEDFSVMVHEMFSYIKEPLQ